MPADSFNSLGGFSVNIPPVNVINSSGNVISNVNTTGNVAAYRTVIGNPSNTSLITSTASYTTTATTANQVVYSVDSLNVAGVDFIIVATNSTINSRQIVNISSVILGSTVAFNQTSSVNTNGVLGTFSVDYLSPNIRLRVTPSQSSSTTYKIVVQTITA